MAYNNGFPIGYQPYYPPQYQPSPPQPQQMPQAPAQQPMNTSSIIWVQGEAGAKSYLVAPNNTVQLWDSENQTIYLKSADASGMPSMKILDYQIREATSQIQQPPVVAQTQTDYVTRTELDAFESKINAKFDKLLKKEEVNSNEPAF